MARRPKLTKLDEAVLAVVPAVRGRRPSVVRTMLKIPSGEKRPTEIEVRQILRGLESIGLVDESGGWWTRCS